MFTGFNRNHKLLHLFLILIFLFLLPGSLNAQQVIGLSTGYSFFPSVKIDVPEEYIGGEKVQTRISTVGLAFPIAFKEGKILILNNLGYRRVDFEWENAPENTTASTLDRVISINYTMFMLDSLSEKWTMVAAITPGLASDFKADKVTSDDFTLQVIFGFIRKHSKNFQLGYGLAYMRDFGRPLPLPFIYFDWKKGEKLSAKGLVPVDMALYYKLHPKLDLGLAFRISGDRHHGDPDIYSGTDNPQLEYSEGTLSPSLNIHLLPWLHLNLEGGYAPYRNFNFLDGDESAGDYDLEKTAYYRVNLILGM
ncbi:MAG: DUF6268 family outer membrane beta-barrel protein [Candidatus Neomarinimicrobiota bacterium]